MSTATELLRRALESLKDAKEEVAEWGAHASPFFREKYDYEGSITKYDPLIEELAAFLADEPEAEPVDQECYAFAPSKVVARYPFPPRPEPARKPMTEKEINRELPFECSGIYFDGFRSGIDFAEKHHGIGGGDE